jgi:hypothetical protein
VTFKHHPHSQLIEAAPRDGTHILVVRPDDGVLFEVTWDPTGNSRNPQTGVLDVPGFWFCVDGSGWFEVGEVNYWLPKAQGQHGATPS